MEESDERVDEEPKVEEKAVPNDKEELQIEVCAPEKVGEGLISAHVEYTLNVKTNLDQYKKKEFKAVRRYSHFAWLRERLCETHKGYLIPPLPEKALLSRFNAEFLEYRRRELQSFVRRLTTHKVLRYSPELQLFLEAENLEHLISTSPSKTAKKEQQSGGLFSFLGSSLESFSNINFTTQNEPDQWFDAKKNYINQLEVQLTALAKASNSIIKKQKELAAAMNEFANISSLLASNEADMNQPVSTSFNKLSEASSQMAALNDKLADEETAFFEDSLRDYIRIIGAAKEMLSVRNEKLQYYQNATKQLDLKKEKLEKTRGKADKELEDAEKKMDDAKQEFNNLSNISRSELELFEEKKSADMLFALRKLSQTNINHGLQIVDQWKGCLALLSENLR